METSCEDRIYLPIPRSFSREKRIKRSQFANALLLMGAIRSFAGMDGICFASIGFGPDDEVNPKILKPTLCSRSGLTKNTVVKYKKLLAELGWIQVKREGGQKNDSIKPFWEARPVVQNPTLIPCDSNPEKNNTNELDLGNINPNTMESESSIPTVGEGFEVQNPINKNVHKIDEAYETKNQPAQPEIEIAWKDFLKWCERSRIPFSTLKNLYSLKVVFDENKIQIASVVTKSAHIYITRYFAENLRGKYSPWFHAGIIEDHQFSSDSLFKEARPPSAFKPNKQEPERLSDEDMESFIKELEKLNPKTAVA
ncbi:helix-turn-helix domain-containing protein [Leptospira barantonii]|uniref:Helix-turn-helix domain-containing protein n=1 Tax=Leptospira barantonii TaxID=2023184 RepID=A0A5F2BGX8_9LEPT|nr:helix-turn-helix domain-containing protein [Leptospira barantonii]TGM04824.1 helix-turn-helix domain-containing protein [Leptospira barantonii]